MRVWLERYANRLWYETECPAWPWRALAGLHRVVLGGRWQRPAGRPPVPVLVVGNLAVGGSGKTPSVIALARHLHRMGLRTGIISRGYGRSGSSQGDRRPLRVNPDSDPDQCGDEPVFIAQATGLPVWVCRDRRAALESAVIEGAEVVVSDDGLQHRRLARSFEIVLIDGQRRFGNGRLLPAGPLRQPVARLEQADAVLFRAAGDSNPDQEQCFDLVPEALVRLDDGARLAPRALAGQAVSAVCGIAHPAQFVRTLEALGQQPTLFAFPDHHRFVPADLRALGTPIVTTAKDAVKLRRLGRLPGSVYVLEVSATLPDSLLQAVTDHVQQFVR
ncbi:MAG: tetraacyldisaccharide 4'-kinase [Wenzhouxiangella sp.]|jgi:tetraacyldisaccharide 4'-kinase|nr:tetraacyldisaccharide 4'-kinase [Wenzhouxiangella sp.]